METTHNSVTKDTPCFCSAAPSPLFALLIPTLAASAQDGYPLFRGNLQRTASADPAAGKELRGWNRPLLLDKHPQLMPDEDEAAKKLLEPLLKKADPSILPAFHPITVKGVCVYRSHRDVRCVTFEQTKVEGLVLPPGDIVWKGVPEDFSLCILTEQARNQARLNSFLNDKKLTHLVWANPMIGALSFGWHARL